MEDNNKEGVDELNGDEEEWEDVNEKIRTRRMWMRRMGIKSIGLGGWE